MEQPCHHPSRSAETDPGLTPVSVFNVACPSRRVLELIADKWTLLLLPALTGGPKRNGELMRLVEGISQKMLTQTLKELQRNGLVSRHDFAEVPPRVEYALTALGQSLGQAMRQLDNWVEAHFGQVVAARVAFEAAESLAQPSLPLPNDPGPLPVGIERPPRIPA